MVRRSPQPTTAARATPEMPPGPRRRARLRPPPPAPRAADSCPDQTSLFELEEDLAAKAVAKRQVDECQRGDQEGQRNGSDRRDEKQRRRDPEKHAAQPLREVVRLRPVLDRV